jgi:selenide,water dikinase
VDISGSQLCLTVDFFKSFVSDPYVFGIIAANHAMSDCHAKGVEAQTG